MVRSLSTRRAAQILAMGVVEVHIRGLTQPRPGQSHAGMIRLSWLHPHGSGPESPTPNPGTLGQPPRLRVIIGLPNPSTRFPAFRQPWAKLKAMRDIRAELKAWRSGFFQKESSTH